MGKIVQILKTSHLLLPPKDFTVHQKNKNYLSKSGK